jgi:hypothetical protein
MEQFLTSILGDTIIVSIVMAALPLVCILL